MTDDPNGWPDPARPGVPLNPERDGHHWCCVYPSLPFPIVWRHDGIGFCWDNGYSPEQAAKHWRYLGPCLTPAEVQAHSAAAAAEMREACAKIVDAHAAAAKRCSEEGDVIYRIRAEFLANSYAITQAANDVRVTPLPAPDALARMLAEAKRAGMDQAAKWHDEQAAYCSKRAAERMAEGHRSAFGALKTVQATHENSAAAIRARMEDMA
jgi:hypothetical protein